MRDITKLSGYPRSNVKTRLEQSNYYLASGRFPLQNAIYDNKLQFSRMKGIEYQLHQHQKQQSRLHERQQSSGVLHHISKSEILPGRSSLSLTSVSRAPVMSAHHDLNFGDTVIDLPAVPGRILILDCSIRGELISFDYILSSSAAATIGDHSGGYTIKIKFSE